MFSKTKKNYIYYTGIGASKTKRHTKKKFLKIAKKQFKSCTSKKCKKIKNSRKNLLKMILKKKCDANDYLKMIDKLDRCNKKYKCSLKEYIKFSGAEIK
tara:strand:- start:8081 stop:8377 length:297 start_codon:yes stop_codon:yes gene_type:complete